MIVLGQLAFLTMMLSLGFFLGWIIRARVHHYLIWFLFTVGLNMALFAHEVMNHVR